MFVLTSVNIISPLDHPTEGDEISMLEDFYVAVQDLNSVTFTIVRDEHGTLSQPKVTGSR